MAVIQLRETTLADEIYKVATQEGKSADDVLADAAVSPTELLAETW